MIIGQGSSWKKYLGVFDGRQYIFLPVVIWWFILFLWAVVYIWNRILWVVCLKLKLNSMGDCLPILLCVHCRRKCLKTWKTVFFYMHCIFTGQITSLTEVNYVPLFLPEVGKLYKRDLRLHKFFFFFNSIGFYILYNSHSVCRWVSWLINSIGRGTRNI